MSDNVMAIAATEAQHACRGEPDLMERIKKAMKACHGHWMETNPSNQFRAAVAAAMLESEELERDRIERSADALKRANAAIQAMQAGLSVDLEEALKADEDTIPLMKMWREVAAA